MTMRIIIAGDVNDRRVRFAHALSCDSRDIVSVDLDRVEAEIRERSPHVLVLDLPQSGGVDLIRGLRAVDTSRSMYIISVIDDRFASRTYTGAIAAGSHDVLNASSSDEELCARVDIHRRLRGWSAISMPQPDTAPPKHAVLSELRAWDYLGDVVGDDLETMLGQPLRIEERWLPTTVSLQIATIAMSLPSELLELCISVAADATTRQWLGEKLLGDAQVGEDSLDDVMREMANVAAGALKRAMQSEGPVLTTALKYGIAATGGFRRGDCGKAWSWSATFATVPESC
jgi:DNA-binding response OmpR family regulator